MFSKNQIVNVSIEDLGSTGEGIGKCDGFPLFIKDSLPGDEIEARIVKLKKNYGYARVERVITPSPFRVSAPCKEARRCGGCQIMEMDYRQQLIFKENKVRNNLVRLGGFNADFIDRIMEPIVGMDGEALRYRNKAQFPVGKDKEGNLIAGFYAGRTHSIISCDDCLLGVNENKDIIDIVLDFMNEYKVSSYDEETGKGLVRHILIRKGFATGEIMVCLVINGNGIPNSTVLCERLAAVEGMTSISISVNKNRTNVIMGDSYETIWGKATIKDVMKVKNPKDDFDSDISEGITYEISPLSFYQVNPVQVEKLYGVAISFASLTGEEEVWDICCGIGTITLSMASKAKKVHGIEIVPQAIEDAKNNAKANGIENAEFICAPAEEYLPAHKDEINADVIVLDPPRKGMDEKALEVVAAANPKRIVYVSCDSATLARDLKYLCSNGYELKKVRACDMFPMTVHVEVATLLCRQKV